MSDAKKSLVATLFVLAVIASLVAGSGVRERIEVGPGVPVGGPFTVGVVASGDGAGSVADAARDPVSETALFYQLMLLLQKEYVDPIGDEQALAVGAVRGMVNSLADSASVFYKPEQMKSLELLRSGVYTGIGAELKLVYNEDELAKLQNIAINKTDAPAQIDFDPLLLVPTVIVSSLAEGGPAFKAGIRAGDRITRVNDKWAVSSAEIDEVRALRAKVDAGEMTAEQIEPLIDAFRKKLDVAIAPARAAELLATGTRGNVEVEWRDVSGKTKSAVLVRARISLPAVEADGDSVRLRFFKGAAEGLAAYIKERKSLTLDLRQSTMGDYEAMRQCLELLAPKGDYGTISREQAGRPLRLTVVDGAETERDIRLIVDGSTWGAGAVFARALVDAGLAEIVEGELTPFLPWIETVRLPDGSGYTLHTGTFTTQEAKR